MTFTNKTNFYLLASTFVLMLTQLEAYGRRPEGCANSMASFERLGQFFTRSRLKKGPTYSSSTLKVVKEDALIKIIIIGSFNHKTYGELDKAGVLAPGLVAEQLVIDLARVTQIDSAALGVLRVLQEKSSNMLIINANPRIKSILSAKNATIHGIRSLSDIQLIRYGGQLTIKIFGEFDYSTYKLLQKAHVFDGQTDVTSYVLDLSSMSKFRPSALGVISLLQEHTLELTVVAPSLAVKRQLNWLNLPITVL
ncbi:MAG: STAS domain-containing protein [Bacteriovoracaceae bacterium]|nr:STAS domain-containing protein [Bacteriovoracaceae bacterium]